MHALERRPHRRASILIVEDEALIARDLESTLEDMGYDIVGMAVSSVEAIELASHRCPDLVLMDIRLRGEPDGIETAALMRERFRVPVVYLTAHADDETLKRAAETRPYGYVIKPFKAAEVKSAIELALHRHGLDMQLAERERWFSTTVQAVSDAVIACDAEQRVRFMNPSAEKLTGWTEEEAAGRSLQEVFRLVSRQTGARIDDPVASALSARLRRPSEDAAAVRTAVTNGKLVDRQGKQDRIVDNAVARVVEDGAVLGAVLVFRDATERHRLEEQATLADRLGSLGTMAASVAHEINNPLTFNLGNVEFALQELASLRQHLPDGDPASALGRAIEALEDAQDGAKRIAAIVANLRSLSRAAPNPVDAIDARACVRQAIKLVSRQIALAARLVEELDPTPLVAGNEVRLSQVAVNLLLNAAQAVRKRPEENEVRVVTGVDELGHAFIEVHDNGPGVPPEIADKIFDPFFTTKGEGHGTGLGLSISRGIVRSFGGDLTLHPREGGGSVFRVLLPPASAFADASDDEPSPGVSSSPRARILLVDDEPLLRKAIHWMLKDHHEVAVASGAEEALSILERQSFDLVLCDLMMPRVGGIDLYEDLLLHDEEHARKMVFMTGGAFQPHVAEFVMKMHARCIQKPFSREHLLAFIDEMLSGD